MTTQYSVEVYGRTFAVERLANGRFKMPPELEHLRGLNTNLKPSWEPILVFRKPLVESTVAKQVLKTGTGALNIDACRVGITTRTNGSAPRNERSTMVKGMVTGTETVIHNYGRWPANTIFTHLDTCKVTGTKQVPAPVINRFDDGMKPFGDGAGHKYTSEQTGDQDGNETIPVYECAEGCPVKTLDEQSGELHARGNIGASKGGGGMYGHGPVMNTFGAGDAGGASRYFSQFEPDHTDEPAYECAEGCPVRALDEQSGERSVSGSAKKGVPTTPPSGNGFLRGNGVGDTGYVSIHTYPNDAGGASRYFSQFEPDAPFLYAAKVSKAERDRGLPKGTNRHPTVKPQSLCRWLVKLITPRGGTVLDPYCGSGSTCLAAMTEGFNFIGIERDPEFHRVAEMRVEAATPKRDIFEEIEDL